MTSQESTEREPEHDLVAIGCGPFNLGLAALASSIDDLDLIVFEAKPELRWHPGLMFDDALFQLSFLADLVTLIDPSHPLSFLAYLRDVERLYPFFIREQFHPTRLEYEAYLRWVAAKLSVVRFGHRVCEVRWDASRERFSVVAARQNGERISVLARDLVIGIGTEPHVPDAFVQLPAHALLHSSSYLERQADLADPGRHVTVVGSGQSAAEVVLDLLRRNLQGGAGFTWLTRSRAFAPLDYSKLVLEMTTPAYVRYFHGLAPEVRERLNIEQWQHYKGISNATLEQIHDLLYQRELKRGLAPVALRCGIGVEAAATSASGSVRLNCRHRDSGHTFDHETKLLICATGYRERRPSFLQSLEPILLRDERGRYCVRLDYSVELDKAIAGRIFVANAELHTHGVATPDLGICAYRNATILNAVTGRECYRLPTRTAFTTFAVPPSAVTSAVQTRSTAMQAGRARSGAAALTQSGQT